MQAFYFDSVDSTNDAAKRLIAEGRLHGRGYVLARGQTAGRGTQGRSWLSPLDAGIYLSIVRTDMAPASADTRDLTLAAGAACAEAIQEVTSLPIQLKPINDLIADGRKLGGILTECVIESGKMSSLIIGIGVNLRRADRPLPPDVMAPVSLEELLPSGALESLKATRLVERIATTVDAYITRVLTGDIEGVRQAWERLLLTDFPSRPLNR